MEALPEQVLGYILAFAGRPSGPSIALVCRQWHRVLYEQADLWPSLAIRVPKPPTAKQAAVWLAGHEALLRRLAPWLTRLQIRGRQLSRVVRMAGRSSSSGVATLLWALRPAAALERLTVDQAGDTLSLATAAALVLLPRLRKLALLCDRVEALAVERLAGLTALASLTVHARHSVPAVERLASLTHLQVLELCSNTKAGAVSFPARTPLLPASAFPVVQRLTQAAPVLEAPEGAVEFASWRPHLGHVPEAWQRMSTVQLRRSPADPTAWLLTVGAVRLTPWASLGALLAALGVDPGRVARLLLDCCSFASGAASLAACGSHALPGATRLLLSSVNGGGRALQELLPALPALTVANLIAVDLAGGLPATLCQRSGLHTLQASDCALAAVPGGPYLSGLTALALDGNRLSAAPPSLAAASRLRQLSLQGNPLRLASADVDGILCRMPALETLEVAEGQLPPAVAAHLAARLPRLSAWRVAPGGARGLVCGPG